MKSLLFFSIFFCSILYAQTNRFIYKLDYKLDSLQKEAYTEDFILDVNDTNTKFYNLFLYETDSINKIEDVKSSITLPIGFFILLKRDINSDIAQNYSFIDSDYYVFKSNDKIDWQLSDKTKTLEGYRLQKATTTFGKRKWIAWFCKDIPIREGPYKFRNLPGLIFSIQDSENNYHFTLIENKKLARKYDTSNILETNFGNKPLNVSFSKYQKLAIINYGNLYADLKSRKDGEWKMETSDNLVINNQVQLKQFIEMEQERYRRNNNPIDKNFIIPYPKK